MSIRAKLFLSFLAISLMILGLAGLRLHFSAQETNLVRELVLDHEISTQLSGLSAAAQKIRRFEKEYFIYVGDPQKREKYAGEFAGAAAEIDAYLENLFKLYATHGRSVEMTNLQVWQDSVSFYADGFDKIDAAVKSGEITGVLEANAAIQNYQIQFRSVLSGTETAIANQYRQATQRSDRIREYQMTASSMFIAAAILAFGLSLVIAFQVPASTIRPLRKMSEITTAISKGQFNNKVEIRGSPEIEELARSIQRLQTATLGLFKRLQNARQEIARQQKANQVAARAA